MKPIFYLNLVDPDGNIYEACCQKIEQVYALRWELAGWTIGFVVG